MNQLIYKNQIIQEDWCFLPQGCHEFTDNKQAIRVVDFFDLGAKVPNFSFGLVIEAVNDFDNLRECFIEFPKNLQLIVCQFNTFRNGVFYSIANILRQDMKYTNQLRAKGDVYFDHLDYLIRSGFDAFDFAEFEDKKKLFAAQNWIETECEKNHYFDQYFQKII